MKDTPSPLWWHACTLLERRELQLASSRNGNPAGINTHLVERYLRRWRSQEPFSDDRIWEKRLAYDNLTQEVFNQLLGEPIESVRKRSRHVPAWLAQIQEAFSQFQVDNPSHEPDLDWPEDSDTSLSSRASLEFLQIIKPLIIPFRRQVRSRTLDLTRRLSHPSAEANTLESLLFKMSIGRLLALLMRPVVYELNISRMLGRLRGETSSDRYQNFLAQLCEPEYAWKFLEEYPVMARLLVTRLNQWKNYSLEFLAHLSTDWDTLRETFCGGEDPGALVELNGNVADYHRDGRAVMILKFASGVKLVYKPKALGVDVHFQELLLWLNEHGADPPFRTFTVLDRGRYGWVEFLEMGDCETREQLNRFYQRQGAYLALLYTLEATDYHLENLIAAGEHPLLIDLESLFHGHPVGKPAVDADERAGLAMDQSVLRVGLLPWRLPAADGFESLDLSGLSGAGGQQCPDTYIELEKAGTDEMRLSRQHLVFPPTHNLPTLKGQPVNALDFVDQLEAGFSKMYRLLLQNRTDLLAERSPLQNFARDEVRAIVCATRTYALLLSESAHPVILGDALEFNRFLDKLWDGIEQFPYLEKVIHAEIEDLQRGDIPFFTSQPNSADIWSSTGHRIPDFFEKPGLELVQQCLKSMSHEDLNLQRWYMRAAFAAMSKVREPTTRGNRKFHAAGPATPAKLVEAACRIGDHLVDSAWRGRDGDVNWIGLSLNGKQQYTVMPLRFDLYSGTSGIALFMAHLARITSVKKYQELAQATLATIQRQINVETLEGIGLGVYDGWGGVIYTLTHLGVLWQRTDLLQQADSLLDRIAPMVEQDDALDLISGSAGCIIALSYLHRLAGSAKALSLARDCGDHLVAQAQPQEVGLGWETWIPALSPLTGFGHGTAGIAWALSVLAAWSGDERYRAIALDALEYERSLFDPQAGNWPDRRDFKKMGLREENEDRVFHTAWCHGAPGIGLGRALMLEHENTHSIRRDLEQAVQTTLKTGFGGNHSLCHGDLGNLDFLLTAGKMLGDEDLIKKGKQIASSILADIQHNRWKCGLPVGGETSGLMTGLAGIGYGLLRAAFPHQVPSVLSLSLPDN